MISGGRDFAKFIRDSTKATAAERLGTITARNANGTYQITDMLSGQVVTVSRRTPRETWPLKTRILYGAADASGRVLGASPVILGHASRDFRGLAGSATAFTTESFFGLIVIRVSPMPARLTRGGSAVVVTISGRNLVGPVTYSDANVSNDAAQVITATLVTLTIKANPGAGIGLRDITVGSITIPNAIEII